MTRTPATLDIPDLSTKRVLLTGASDGMGLHIAIRLAKAGAELVLPVRNRAKGEAAVAAVLTAAPEARVSLRDLDLASLAAVASLGSTLREEGLPIHVLIANAGLMTPPTRQLTADGFELQFGTNFLGHVALVGHLMPLLLQGNARVVSQISVVARRGKILWDDLQSESSYDAMAAYGSSKVALGLFGLELQRRSQAGAWGITSNLAHPGVAPTNLLAAQPGFGRNQETREVRLVRALSRIGLAGTPESAALPAVVAATLPAPLNDSMIGPKGLGGIAGAPARQALYASLTSASDAQRIWDIASDLIGSRDATWKGFPSEVAPRGR